MRRSEDAVIPMQKNSEQINILCGALPDSTCLPSPFQPFSTEICTFLNDLSSLLMKHPQSRYYPDIMTFGFFCRKANIEQKRLRYGESLANRLGRGMTFHIAPSNVPINFAYSMTAALLAGNACIVRASSKPFPQTEIVCGEINKLLDHPEYSDLKKYITVVRYQHNKEINDQFSSMCDIRIIWGGDNTIAEVRRSPLLPRATEITFADRYSAAVFDASAILQAKPDLAHEFFNDTYLYDQNACSSPRLIYWIGETDKCADARKYFWDMIHEHIKDKYHTEPVLTVDKYTTACRLAIEQDAVIIPMPDMSVSRIEVRSLSPELQDHRCAGGSFIEYQAASLEHLAGLITQKVQTISYYGDLSKTLADLVIGHRLTGIDRIVPVGKTADFDLIWDGYDLIIQMSRCISIK